VTPKELSPGASEWVLDIALDTHSVELDDDLVAQTVLVDDQGNEHQPLSWEGDPPGGHHRRGMLTFARVAPFLNVFRLIIKDVGGIAERIFEWNL
jgi:hypothetical protein